jgi:hypothetical protein
MLSFVAMKTTNTNFQKLFAMNLKHGRWGILGDGSLLNSPANFLLYFSYYRNHVQVGAAYLVTGMEGRGADGSSPLIMFSEVLCFAASMTLAGDVLQICCRPMNWCWVTCTNTIVSEVSLCKIEALHL